MIQFLVLFLLFLMTITVHEVSHGFVAYLRGDDTAHRLGRLTLNPFRHIDFFWTIFFPAFLLVVTGGRFALGMAKPVPVNFSNLRRPRQDMVLVAVAGPIANLIFAWFLAVWFHASGYGPFLYGIYLNLGLAFFNLIPVPPLDGSRILAAFLPKQWARVLDEIEPLGFLIIMVLYAAGALFAFIMPAVNFFVSLLRLPPVTI